MGELHLENLRLANAAAHLATVVKFRLELENGALLETPRMPMEFLIPPDGEDEFGAHLNESVLPVIERRVAEWEGE